MSTRIEIKSRPGTFITLDDDVAEKIGHWGWWLLPKGYVSAHIPGSGEHGRKVRLARAVMWATTGQFPPKGMDVDHINHDLLDNRIENLRVVTRTLNQRNQLKRKGEQFKWVRRLKFDTGIYLRGHVCLTKNGRCIDIYGKARKDTPIKKVAREGDCIAYLVGGYHKDIFNFPNESFISKWHRLTPSNRDKITTRLYNLGFLNNATRMLVQVPKAA
jgi:hypothetical protein